MNRWTRLFLLTAVCALMMSFSASSAFAKDASADIDQCANGPITAIVSCSGSAWQNGNLNSNQAHWFEGDFVPYRLKFADLVDGQQYTVQLQWDTTKSGKHAIDYIGNYDATETTGAADPANFHANQINACGDYLAAALCATPTAPALPGADNIPEDATMITRPDWGGGSTGSTGHFTMWGGSVSAVGNQVYTGSWASDGSAYVLVTFTAATGGTGKAVLAWSGHIGTRQNWGVNNSAISISGSPYHMRLLNLDPPNRGGNMDRSLSAAAVIYPAFVTITKQTAAPTSTAFAFGASGTGFTFPYPTSTDSATSFNLDTAAGGNPSSLMSNRIVTFGTQRTVTETEPNSLWTLNNISCSVTPGIGGGGTAAQDGVNPLQTNFDLQEGDLAQCTYVNDFTPATTRITTQVTDSSITVGDSTTDTATLSGGFGTLGGTITWKLYADSTCTTQIGSDITQTVNGTGNYDFPAGSSVTPTSAGDYYWYAEYTPAVGDNNNTGSHTGCADASEKVTVGPASTSISTQVTDSSITIGDSTTDTATLSGGYGTLGGTITWKLYSDDHCGTQVGSDITQTVNGTGNYNFPAGSSVTPTSAGDYYWYAEYTPAVGDVNNTGSHTGCSDATEKVTVGPASTTITTQVTDSSITVGDPTTDTATLSGGHGTLGGTITWKLYSDGTCTTQVGSDITQSVNGTGNYNFPAGSSVTPTQVGDYYWYAEYTPAAGDNNNTGSHTGCADASEKVTVGPAGTSISTQVTDSSITIGDSTTDTATLSGGYGTLGGTITWKLYSDGTCTTQVGSDITQTVNGTGNYNFPAGSSVTPIAVGDYYWYAEYTPAVGDNNNTGSHTGCADATEKVTVNKDKPSIQTHATPSVTIGTKISDEAVVTGGYQTGGRTVHFDVYKDSCAGAPITTIDGTLPANPNGNGEFIVSVDFDKPTAAGTYYWVARMDANATNEAADHEACGDPDETSLVNRDKPVVHTQVSDSTIGLGHTVTDNIELTGGYQIAGQDVSVKVYGPNDANCQGAGTSLGNVTLDGNQKATITFKPTQVGHYTFVVSYAGDGNNDPAAGLCSDTAEQFDVVAVDLNVTKDPNDTHAYDGDKVSFTITAKNTGTDSLADVKVVDNIQGTSHACETLTFVSGDANSNKQLDPGETWKWTCTMTVVHAEEIGSKIVNVAHIEGTTVHGGDSIKSNQDDASVPISHPAIAIDKTGPATAQAGDKVSYVLTVTNPGDTSFAESKVTLADEQCNGDPVSLVGKGGDGSPASLDPGDAWTYSCSVQTAVGDQAIHNVASVNACDQFNKCVTASDPADTQLTQPEQILLPARVTPGSAQLLGPTGCVSRAFNARVRGAQIATVTFVLDGKVVKRVRNTKNAKLIKYRVNPKKLKLGVHRMVVNVTFKSGSGTKPRSIRLSFQRCGKKLAAPRFTG